MPLKRGKPALCVQFRQTIARENSIWHLYEIFCDPVGRLCWYTSQSLASWGGTRDYQCIRFQTYSHPELKFYDDLFYPAHGALQYKGRKKRVPKNINELITPKALAYWFMDDGGCKSYKSKNRTYRFSTHSFPCSDQALLVQILRDNF